MKLFHGNFDFEHQLWPAGARQLPAAVRRINVELAFTLAAIAECGDLVWTPEAAEPDFSNYLAAQGFPGLKFAADVSDVPQGAELFPWGWSRPVRQWGLDRGCVCECPDSASVAAANSRAFSSSLEREWNVGLAGARTVRSVDGFCEAVEHISRRSEGWVVKANYGMSARERILGRGSPPRSDALGWVRKQLAVNEAVYFEPWVERLAEFGCQFTIPRSGDPVLEGVARLLSDASGQYRGSGLVAADDIGGHEIPETVIQLVCRAASRVQRTGYFGPLGIDLMNYRSCEVESGWRPLQDVNARLTMGRLALGLRRLLRPGETASWLHLRSPGTAHQMLDREQELSRSLPRQTRFVRTSPVEVGGQRALHRAYLIAAPSAEELRAAERHVFQRLQRRDDSGDRQAIKS